MKVRAVKSIKNQYYALEEGQEYEVYAIVYFATPFFSDLSPVEVDSEDIRKFVNPLYSYGVIRNELVYIIKSTAVTGREVLARFNVANFRVVDPSIPANWSTSVIDLYKEVTEVKSLFEKYENEDAVNFIKPLEMLKSYNAKVIVTGSEKFHSFSYLQAVCDDD